MTVLLYNRKMFEITPIVAAMGRIWFGIG